MGVDPGQAYADLVAAHAVGRCEQQKQGRGFAQLINNDLEHKLILIIGLFVVSCLASSLFYGWDMVIILVVGLLLFAAMLRAIGGG